MKFVPTPHPILVKETRIIERSNVCMKVACQGWSISFKGSECAESNIIKWSTFDCMLSACLRNYLMCLWGYFLTRWTTIELYKERYSMDLLLKIQLFQICIPTTWSAESIPPSLSTSKCSVWALEVFHSGCIGQNLGIRERGSSSETIRSYSGNSAFDSWLAIRTTSVPLILLSITKRCLPAGNETTFPSTFSLWHRQVLQNKCFLIGVLY